jgi:hypothetical protein
MGSPYFVWINTNEIISSWYLLGAVCDPPAQEHKDAQHVWPEVVDVLVKHGASLEVMGAGGGRGGGGRAWCRGRWGRSDATSLALQHLRVSCFIS